MNPFPSGWRTALATAAAAALMLAAGAAAQGLPGGSVRLMVGYPSGGPVDQAARLLAPALGRELGAAVIVENKAGANATLAGDLVARSRPDGATLWFAASPSITISPNVSKQMPFDPARDLTPIAPVLSYHNVLVIHKELPFGTVSELIAFAKDNPEKISYGSSGVGSSNHLSGELFALRSGTRLSHIPYKGNAPALTDVMGGQLSMMFSIIGNTLPFIASGKLRALAVTSPQRNPSLPGVPTMAESGLAGFDAGGWFGLYAAPNTPAVLTARINKAMTAAITQPQMTARLQELGYELWTGAPKMLAERAAQERALWAGVTRGIEIE